MRFRPEQHLRRQSDIQAAREKGSRLDCRAFAVWCRRRDPEAPLKIDFPRAGVVASRAAVGGAVQRNRAKRRMRELFRSQQHLIPKDCDLLFVARGVILKRPYAELKSIFIETCQRISGPTFRG